MTTNARLLGVVLLSAAACTKGAPEPASPRASPPVAGARDERPEYRVELQAPQGGAAGSEVAVVVRVVAGDGFHVNAEYPMAFTFDEAEGLRFPERKVLLAGSVERTPCASSPDDACEVRARLRFTADKAARLSGLLSFSVCQPEKCLVEKVRLAVDVPVQ
jgi:hypothetical protein